MTQRVFDWFIRIIVVAALIMSFATYRNQQIAYQHQKSLAVCVAQWADQYTAASSVRTTANTYRLDALNRLLVDALLDPGGVRAQKALQVVIQDLADDKPDKLERDAAAYLKVLKRNAANPMIEQDVRLYINVETNYANTVAQHPLPIPPKESCE